MSCVPQWCLSYPRWLHLLGLPNVAAMLVHRFFCLQWLQWWLPTAEVNSRRLISKLINGRSFKKHSSPSHLRQWRRTLKRGLGQDQSQQGVDPILSFQSILGHNTLHQSQPHFSKPRPSLSKSQPTTLIDMMKYVVEWFNFEEDENTSCDDSRVVIASENVIANDRNSV